MFLRKLILFLLGLTPKMENERSDIKIEHIRGKHLNESKSPTYDKILIVDDVPRYAQASLATIKDHFVAEKLTVYLAYSYAAAKQVFNDHDIKLVVLDCDLSDEDGNGEMLAREFIKKKSSVKILANSSRSKFNKRLLDAGAIESINKNPKRFLRWLKINCRC